MQIIAELNNASENEKIDFIIEYNRKQGCEIEQEEISVIEEVIVQNVDEDGNAVQKIEQQEVKKWNLKALKQTDEEKAQERKEAFYREFFNTSLGCIRRKVTMADGSKKDFLSDLLPVISMAVNMNTPVSVIAYDEPDFTQDVEDWTQYQHIVQVTAQFVQECFNQLQNDFIGVNSEN